MRDVEPLSVRATRARAEANRARQFIPFAALRGYEEVISKQAHPVETRHVLSADEARGLSWKIEHLHRGERVRVTYYSAEDEAYACTEGTLGQIDTISKTISVADHRIGFSDLLTVETSQQDEKAPW
ncbi:MAG: hypothetical protein KHY83_06610 [Coriobacteriia bacterium]|nr:hypothetical protein [Coriobacteriia bacterium]